MSTIGKRLLSSIIFKQDRGAVLRMDLFPELFKDSEVTLFEFVMDHLVSYGVIPSQDTIEFKLGDVLVEAPEPPEYYLQEVETRFLQSRLKKLIIEASESLGVQEPNKAFDRIIDQISELSLLQKRRSLLDFRQCAEIIHTEYYLSKKGEDGNSLFLGWPSLDGMTGGMKAGDVCSVVGRPTAGKTFLLLFSALKAWNASHVPLFVSMEMNNLLISQRLAAMEGHKHLTQLLKGMLTSSAYKSLLTTLQGLKQKEKPFWIVDGNLAATVDDLVLYCQQLKPSALFIDGTYMLRSNNPRIGKWERMSENAEAIKQRIASDLRIPCICSYQLSKEFAKKQKAGIQTKAGMEDIYGVDAVAQLSSVILGLFQEDSVETQLCRRVEVLKGRNGETGEFLINWDFVGMNFEERASKKTADGKLVASMDDFQFIS